MTAHITLTDTQREVIKLATYRPDGHLEPLPPTLRGGAKKSVVEGLLTRGLIAAAPAGDGVAYVVTDAGYAAVGRKRKSAAVAEHPEDEAPAAAASKSRKTKRAPATPTRAAGGAPLARANSKQAQVIAMLKRPEGATIPQIMAVTDWQPHTVRGTFAGAFKKKLGLAITSSKESGGERVYRIVA